MDGPSNSSLDILGIEIGSDIVRGVCLNQATTELTAASEYELNSSAVDQDGIVDPAAVTKAIDILIDRLGVLDRSQVQVGLSIGPRNAGVGSGPAIAGWLEEQAANLQESLTFSGDTGIAFVPCRAVDAAIKVASDCGVELVRVDLAPVAGARAIGEQVDDIICLGSGRGWQARMRDFEVLEAMENPEVGVDDPMSIVGDGPKRTISRYGWVEVSAELDQVQRLDIGQLAPAVGVAIGVAFESPANLLLGQEVGRPAAEERSQNGAYGGEQDLSHLAGYELPADPAESTIHLAPRVPKHNFKQRFMEAQAAVDAEASAGSASSFDRPDGESSEASALDSSGSDTLTSAELTSDSQTSDGLDESDPIAMFSPDTEVDDMMGTRESRITPVLLFMFLLVSALGLLLAYIYV